MKKIISWAIATVISLSVLAANESNPIQEAINMGPGVHNPKLNERGEMISFVVVGSGRIRKSLPKQLALQQARKDAAREARNETAKFFNTSVKWGENAANEMVCVTQGSSAGDEENSGTSAEKTKFVEASGERSKACSQAALSGLRKIGSGYDENGLYCEVWGWQFKTVKAIVNASKAMGKAARASINEAKAVEGARKQDPHAAYRKAEKRDAQRRGSHGQSTNTKNAVYGRNGTLVKNTHAASDADDFF